MSDKNQDIREWAKSRGKRIGGSGPIPASIRDEYDEFLAAEADTSTEETSRVEERAPQESAPGSSGQVSTFAGMRERVRRRFWNIDRTDRMLTSRPKRSDRPRVSIDRLIQRAWGALSDMAKPVNLPVSRVLALQSPVAGLLLEETIRNTAIDRLLQPLARGGAHAEVAHALLGPPLLTLALTMRPEAAPLLIPFLKDALRTWVDVAGPSIERAARREAEYQEKYGGTVDAIVDHIFNFESDATAAPDGRVSERAAI